MKQIREKSDYNDFYVVASEEAEEQIKVAEKVLSSVVKYVQLTGEEAEDQEHESSDWNSNLKASK